LGGSAIAGTVVAFSTVGGMITSLLLVQIELTLKKYLISVMLLIMGAAFLTITLTNSIALVMISVPFIGLGQGSLFPFLTLKTSNKFMINISMYTSIKYCVTI